MNSKCPQCQKEIEHEDYLFEVRCECGTRFNPFFDANVGAVTPEVPEPVPKDASESKNAFQDIISFGEDLKNPPVESNPSQPPQKNEIAEQPKPAPIKIKVATASTAEVLVVTASEIPSKTIEQWFQPLSVQFTIDGTEADPLEKATELLKQKASEKGANGIVSLKVWVASDLTRGLLFGIPVLYV